MVFYGFLILTLVSCRQENLQPSRRTSPVPGPHRHRGHTFRQLEVQGSRAATKELCLETKKIIYFALPESLPFRHHSISKLSHLDLKSFHFITKICKRNENRENFEKSKMRNVFHSKCFLQLSFIALPRRVDEKFQR